MPLLRRARGGDEGLGQQFAAEGARAAALGAVAFEAVVVEPGEVE